eukprot:766864-Hanusia_phi.AAC.1
MVETMTMGADLARRAGQEKTSLEMDASKKSSSDTKKTASSSGKRKKSKGTKEKFKGSRDKDKADRSSSRSQAQARKDEEADELLRGMGDALSKAVPKAKVFDPLAGLNFGLPASGADRESRKREEDKSRGAAVGADDFGMEEAANLIKASGVRAFAEHHAPPHPSRSSVSSSLAMLSEESFGDSPLKDQDTSREEEEEEEGRGFSKFGNIRMAGDLEGDEAALSVQKEKSFEFAKQTK